MQAAITVRFTSKVCFTDCGRPREQELPVTRWASSLVDELPQEARRLQGESIAESSRRVYESRLRVYVSCCRPQLHVETEPITVDKMMAFIVLQKRAGTCWSTLANYVQGFTRHFAQKRTVLTQSPQFKVFKDGLRRAVHAGTFPNAKVPFRIEWLGQIAPQRHRRWKSLGYVRYAPVDMVRAGREIGGALHPRLNESGKI